MQPLCFTGICPGKRKRENISNPVIADALEVNADGSRRGGQVRAA